jgi:hypothetical protein
MALVIVFKIFSTVIFKSHRRLGDFEVLTTVDAAADTSKINGNEFRDILYNEIKNTQRIGELECDTRDFSLTNLEGKILKNAQFFSVAVHTFIHSSAFVIC